MISSLQSRMGEVDRYSGQVRTRSEANHILKNLPDMEYRVLLPHFEPVSLRQNAVLFEVAAPITYGYFVNTGLVSTLAVMANGDSVEVGLLSKEGFAGLPILLNIGHSSSRLVVQIPGNAIKIEADVLHYLLPKLPMLERLLSRFAYLQALRMEQIAACNGLHEIEERLARWLLMAQDRVSLEVLPVTHDQIASMLGTRRSSISVAANVLQKLEIIDYRRGSVHILSRERLEEASCECYAIVRAHLEAYLKTGTAVRPDV